MLESQMLADLTPDLIKQLSAFLRAQQKAKAPVSRSTMLIDNAMREYGEWLQAQDIPKPFVPAIRGPFRDAPPTPHKRDKDRRWSGAEPVSPTASPSLQPRAPAMGAASSGEDDIFAMDVEAVPVAALEPLALSASPPRPDSASTSDPKLARVPQWKTVTTPPRSVKATLMINMPADDAVVRI